MADADVAGRMRDSGVVAVVRAGDAEDALRISRRLVAAGVDVIEVAFTVPQAERTIATLATEGGSYLLGAGTVLRADQARLAVRAGARFLVSPAFTQGVAAVARDVGVPYIPGVLTPTEVTRATEAGCRLLKLFPARIATVDGLRALMDPFPDVAFLASGIEPATMGEWLRAGAVAVAFGGYLTQADDLAARVVWIRRQIAAARGVPDPWARAPEV